MYISYHIILYSKKFIIKYVDHVSLTYIVFFVYCVCEMYIFSKKYYERLFPK